MSFSISERVDYYIHGGGKQVINCFLDENPSEDEIKTATKCVDGGTVHINRIISSYERREIKSQYVKNIVKINKIRLERCEALNTVLNDFLRNKSVRILSVALLLGGCFAQALRQNILSVYNSNEEQ